VGKNKWIYKPGSVLVKATIIHLDTYHYAPQATYPKVRYEPHLVIPKHNLLSYLVLHRMGFTKRQIVTDCPVRSYRTISPLPPKRRFIFCCTVRRLTPPSR